VPTLPITVAVHSTAKTRWPQRRQRAPWRRHGVHWPSPRMSARAT
jgi:hypothetical protein